jgi:hypothetical protein
MCEWVEEKRGCLGLGKGLSGAENKAVDPEHGTNKRLKFVIFKVQPPQVRGFFNTSLISPHMY